MGDKSTGKSSLYNMLQRKHFEESYTHTTQNQSAQIPWEFRLSEVEVSIKIREIVQPRTKQRTGELKTKDSGQSVQVSVITPAVHAIIFMIDPRKKYTLEYVERELKQIEHEPQILLVSNFTDLKKSAKLQITASDISTLIKKSNKNIKYCEASMSDRFGVKAIRTFVNIPFALLEEQFLLEQLERVKKDIQTSHENFDKLSAEQDYDFYKDWLAKAIEEKLRQKAGKNSNPPNPQKRNSPAQRRTEPAAANSKIKVEDTTSTPSSKHPPAQGKPPAEESGGFFSKIKSIVSSAPEEKPPPAMIKKQDPRIAIRDLKSVAALTRSGKQVEASIDAFDPSALEEGNDYDSFFSDDEDAPAAGTFVEESDEEEFNPLVSAHQDFDKDAVSYTKPTNLTPTTKKKSRKPSKKRKETSTG
mmetsp:Transcript_90753/g.135966  ORF Transcript_90753/g.135966 Transcript_90753/m.135966 type:complete len:416 (+) Transcript_90753:1-1248(+)